MGARGPKGKPAEVKRLMGNPGRRPIPAGHVEPSGPTRSPEHLDGYALEVWQRVMRSMPDGVYLATDTETLLAYCDAADTLRRAMWALKIEGHVLRTPYGAKRNPWDAIASQARQQIATLGTRLGLDPLARENITAPDKKPEASKFTGLVGIDGGKA